MSTTNNTQIAAQGSNRIYTRLNPNGESVIEVNGTSRDENHAFITLARHFCQLGLPVPEVYSVSEDEMHYTIEDLGDTLLYNYISLGRTTGNFSEEEKHMLSRTIRLLAHVQVDGAKGLDWSVCYPVPCFDRRSILWDLNYFKYDFLKLTGIEFSEPELEDDFKRLSEKLLGAPCDVFMYRDFQSRNVMIKDGKPYLIDFQGGRKGPIYYDLASFLWQAKANYPHELRKELLNDYIDELAKTDYANIPDPDVFYEMLHHFVLFRQLQVLGAYGFRGLYEHKSHFVQSIPFALHNLDELFNRHAQLKQDYPTLYTVVKTALSNTISQTPATTHPDKTSELLVDIYSFSFKHGIPADESGNGGGYVFDCRSTHNPGKYEQYKHLTGKDQPVIDFLEKDGEISEFLSHVYPIVDHHVERFLERGFTHLQISFGCTGGQHRSVYSAEATARHLKEKFQKLYNSRLHIRLRHRELEK